MSDAASTTAPDPHSPVDLDEFRVDGAYVVVPDEVARRHPLFGVAGWTVALGVVLILDVLVGVFNTFVLFSYASRAGWIVLLALFQAGMLIWMIACIAKLFGQKPDFPGQLTTLCGVNAAYLVIVMLIGGGSMTTFVQLGVVILYIAYVQSSRRVRVTYRNQVLAADPLLAEVFPKGIPAGLAQAETRLGLAVPRAEQATFNQTMARLRRRGLV